MPPGRVTRRHVGRPTFGATVSFATVTLPLFLTNVMLVEMVFSVPGSSTTSGAIGHNTENAINLPIVIAAALWMTVLLIVLGLLADAIVGPRWRLRIGLALVSKPERPIPSQMSIPGSPAPGDK